MADEPDDPHDFDVFAPVQDRGYQFIHLDTVQGISRIVLNRPPANVLSVEALEDLNRALESLEYQRDVKLVVLQATGKYFSAGFELGDHLGDRAYMMLEGFRRVIENLAKARQADIVGGGRPGAGRR
jgi:enoyl-CoA hydratase/carnithine racemase